MIVPVKCNAKYVDQSTLQNVMTRANTLLKPSGAYTGAGQKISADPLLSIIRLRRFFAVSNNES